MDPDVASSNFSSDLSADQKELIQPLICEDEGFSSPPSQMKDVYSWARLPNDSSVQTGLTESSDEIFSMSFLWSCRALPFDSGSK